MVVPALRAGRQHITNVMPQSSANMGAMKPLLPAADRQCGERQGRYGQQRRAAVLCTEKQCRATALHCSAVRQEIQSEPLLPASVQCNEQRSQAIAALGNAVPGLSAKHELHARAHETNRIAVF